ncbi:hypothetical protein N665_0022s0004 [Sinapis alba]|nr:hypothetical protein N665_0022s0004 [Sinapis alba]
MENLLGLLRLRVIRGVNLAIRDSSSSDPYVIVRMGKQMVYDRDWFSRDDKMGDAFFYIDSFLEAVKFQKQLGGLPEGAVIMKIQASRENCLSEESKIVWHKGKIIQNMFLKFQKVECGEVELQLEWIDVSGFLSMEDGGVVY